MAHGQPDWGLTSARTTVFPLTDLGELAARLGAIDVADRRGDVVFQDSFEQGYASWVKTLGAAGSATALYASAARHGAYSVRLTTAAVNNDSVTITRNIAPLVFSLYGLEWSFTASGDGIPDAQQLYGDLRVFDGATLHNSGWRLTLPSGQLAVLTTGSVYTNVGSARNYFARDTLFHTAKLVIDPTNNLYVRLIVDGIAVDVSTVALSSVANTSNPLLQIRATAQTNSAAVINANYDAAILTQNEPA